jgi:arabinogalactan endo-1,4-beta-galactosidase
LWSKELKDPGSSPVVTTKSSREDERLEHGIRKIKEIEKQILIVLHAASSEGRTTYIDGSHY